MTEADASDLHELYSDREAMRYLTSRTPSTVEETLAWIRPKIEQQEDDGLSLWSIIEKASGHVIGDCGLQYEDETRTEIGLAVRLRRASWHQGLAFEASVACLQAGFEQLGLDRIVAMTHEDNLAAKGLLLRLGMAFLERRLWQGMPMVVHVATAALPSSTDSLPRGYPLPHEERALKFHHLHVAVNDLPGALAWLKKVWDASPTFENGGMAVLSLHGASLILDAADEDGTATIGFASDNCDEDYRLASERGAETLEAPKDRAWGVRAAYLRGPGRITFEIEQELPSSD